MYQSRQLTNQGGFTLVELMVVVAILALIIGIVAPNIFSQLGKAEIQRVHADFAQIKTALTAYRTDNYTFPSSEQGLEALVTRPTLPPEPRNWNEDGYLDRLPEDPWGRPYYYLSPGQYGKYDIYTLGADGVAGGEGQDADIGNWAEKQE